MDERILPAGYDQFGHRCRCMCHHRPGVRHFMACCTSDKPERPAKWPSLSDAQRDVAGIERISDIDALRYSHPNGLGGPRDGMTIKHAGDVPGAIASARIMGDKGRENPAERPYTFDRYVGGKLMAEGITIEREATLESAIARAVQLCPRANAPTVLVLRDMETSL